MNGLHFLTHKSKQITLFSPNLHQRRQALSLLNVLIQSPWQEIPKNYNCRMEKLTCHTIISSPHLHSTISTSEFVIADLFWENHVILINGNVFLNLPESAKVILYLGTEGVYNTKNE